MVAPHEETKVEVACMVYIALGVLSDDGRAEPSQLICDVAQEDLAKIHPRCCMDAT